MRIISNDGQNPTLRKTFALMKMGPELGKIGINYWE